VAADDAVPMLRTVADIVTASVSTGLAGDVVTVLTVRSGFGAFVPSTWSSATWPPGAPELAVNESRTSASVALTGIVTTLVPCVNVYVALALMVVYAPPAWSRPSIEKVCVRVPHAGSGLSLTATDVMFTFVPIATFSHDGTAPSQ
jgi:hypothetical protein